MSREKQQKRLVESPEAVRLRRQAIRIRLALCIVSGMLLGLSFPPSALGALACVGLVPLLIVLADVEEVGASLRYSYAAVLVFHLITLNWTGGYAHGKDVYMMIAGAVTMLVHPLFYFIPLGAYAFVKKTLGAGVALIGLPFFWVGYEYLHSLSEWSFPWLTIGNSQSYDLARIQFIDVTGVYGLSFWIVVLNVIAFAFYSAVAQRRAGRLSRREVALAVAYVALFMAPWVHGRMVLSRAPAAPEDRNGTVMVGIVQSNMDPWDKWQTGGYRAIETYTRLTSALVDSMSREGERLDLILWPETAVPYYMLTPANRPLLAEVQRAVAATGVPLLTGVPHAVFYPDSTRAPASAKRSARTGERYDSFNAAALIEPGTTEVQWYGKMKMVPLAERVPYADAFHFISFLQWGVGIGGWQLGPEQTIFRESRTGSRFNAIICYESVYPGFIASFVARGAEFLTMITIDSWWDKMSGAYQHKQFSVFRAVENRRWLVRCALGGISCYIDPYGRSYQETDLFTRTLLAGRIERKHEISFYTQHGDWLGQVCMALGGMLLVAALGQAFFNRQRELLWRTQ